MGVRNRLLPIVTITGGSLAVGCSGDYGGSCGYGSYGSYGSACAAPNISGDGYYEGTLTGQAGSSPIPVIAIIADNGDGAISAQDGSYYRLNLKLAGVNVAGTFYGFPAPAGASSGASEISGSMSGVATPTGLNGSVSENAGAAQTLNLNFDTVYNMSSALTMLAGTWSYTANGFSITATIRQDGTFSGTDSNNCSYTGAFDLIDPNFNAYSETYTRSCNGAQVTFTGLATYFPPGGKVANADIKILADDNVSEFLVADLQ
jgi:hypothetical protein